MMGPCHPEIYQFDVLDSTNTKALELGERGAIHGSCVVAENQTGGRGRLGKQWFSSEGMGLYCSYIVRPDLEPQDYPKITVLAGLAVAQSLDEVAGVNCKLKWPNDIIVNDCKLAGILTESSGLSLPADKRFAVIGVGINCNQQLSDFPEELRSSVTSLYLAAAKKFDPITLVVVIRTRILELIHQLCQSGLHNIIERWQEKDYLCGKTMRCVVTTGEIVVGVAQGVNKGGELLVIDAKGKSHRVLTSDIRLAGSSDFT